MAKGFALNVAISLFAIVFGTIGGIFLGMGQLAPPRWISIPSKILTQIFRNAPWLVLLFYCIFLIPFQVRIGGETYTISNWLRASIGFTIPVIANFSEIVRGACNPFRPASGKRRVRSATPGSKRSCPSCCRNALSACCPLG